MEVEEWLRAATDKLSTAGIGSAGLDALILLEDCLRKDRAWLLAHPETPLQGQSLQRLNRQIARRVSHEPLAYIRGFSEFYGRKFKVNKRVLEPRPESEAMIDLLKALLRVRPLLGVRPLKQALEQKTPLRVVPLKEGARIADVGTGSGCLGITAALELHNHNVDLLDIDAAALAVARHNCELHELGLKCQKRDLLSNSHTHYDVILANLPYVPRNLRVNQAAAMEPHIAIDGGSDGLDVYRRLFAQLAGSGPTGTTRREVPLAESPSTGRTRRNWQPSYVFTESLPPQHEKLSAIATEHGFKPLKTQDFIQVFTAGSH